MVKRFLVLLVLLSGCRTTLDAVRNDQQKERIDFSVETLDGKQQLWKKLIALEPKGPSCSLVVFATPWCESCKRELPDLKKWIQTQQGKTRTFYVVSGAPSAEVRTLVQEQKVDPKQMTVIVDSDGRLAEEYGVSATPTLIWMPKEQGGEIRKYRSVSELDRGVANSTSSTRVTDLGKIVAVGDSSEELGTSYDVVVFVADKLVAKAKQDLADLRRLARAFEGRLSEWQPDSEIAQLNDQGFARSIEVSRSLHDIVVGSIEVSEATKGAFDITWPALSAVWEKAESENRYPTADDLKDTLIAVGWRHVHVDQRQIHFDHPKTRIGIAAVGKGWIIDQLFNELKRLGYTRMIVNIGGDLRTAGVDSQGRKNVFAIEDPYQPKRVALRVRIENVAMATSGNYVRMRTVAGKPVGHILDPRTGFPPKFDGSVTVITRDAAMADALATGLFVMGPEEGLQFVKSMPGVDVIYVSHDGIQTSNPQYALAE